MRIIRFDYCVIGYGVINNSCIFIYIATISLPVMHCFAISLLKPQTHQAYVQVTTYKWTNRRNNVRLVAEVVRLVAEVVGDRKGQISRSKVVVRFNTQSHRAYDQVTTYLRSKNVTIVGESKKERTTGRRRRTTGRRGRG